MELPKGQLSKKEFWLAHIKAAETFDGTNKEYCKRHGLNLGSFSGYKNKFGFSGRKKLIQSHPALQRFRSAVNRAQSEVARCPIPSGSRNF